MYPLAFHIAAAGSWPSIRERGLLSTAALLKFWGEPESGRSELRSETLVLDHPHLGRAIVRDQKPIHRESLEKALEGDLTVEEWLRELNSKVSILFNVKRCSA
jgi:hypothetical protein